jgi:hypothetical protein
MKKISSFLLVALMLFLTCTIETFAQSASSKDTAYQCIDILKSLDIVSPDYDYNSLDETETVTRADFAVYLVKLMNFNIPKEETLYYNDLPRTHYAFNEITYLTSMNLMSGMGEKQFKPDDIMKRTHAYVALLYALGYQKEIIADNVTGIASSAGITKGVSSSNDLLLCDLFIMIYNTLMSDTMTIKGYSITDPSYVKGNTLLYETRKMVYEENGFLTAADGGSLIGETVTTEDIIIDGNKYISYISNIDRYIGHSVNFIYEELDNDNRIAWIEDSGNADMLSIDVDEECYFDSDNWTLTYYKNNSQKTIQIPAGISVLYNGRFVSGKISSIFAKPKYNVTFIKHNGSEYKYAIVTAYENIMVGDIDLKNEQVYNIIDEKYVNFSADDYDLLKILDIDGNEVQFGDISVDSVISVFKSDDESYLKAIVSNEVVSGELKSISSNKWIEVDGNRYKFYNASSTISNSIKSVTLYLDYKGYIAYADKRFLGENQFVGYAYNVKYKRKDNILVFNVLNENGKIVEYSAKDKIRIDGVKYTDFAAATVQFTTLTDGSFKPQMLVFSINAEGILTAVYRSNEEGGTENVLMESHPIKQSSNINDRFFAYARVEQGIIGLNVLFDENTKVFKVPSDADVKNANESQFSVGSPTDRQNFLNAKTYKVTTEDVFFEQYIVCKGATSITIGNTALFFVVDKIITKLDEYGDVATYISGMIAGTDAEYQLNFDYDMDTEILGANSGDVYIIALDDSNKLANYKKVYDIGDTTLKFYSNSGEAKDYGEAESRYFMGYVKDKRGTALKIDYENDGIVDQMANLKSGSGTIVVYDSIEKKPHKGSIDDIKRGSLIIVNTTYNSNISIVVYN